MSTPKTGTPRNLAVAVWGTFGTALILAEAVFRLASIAWNTLRHETLETLRTRDVVFFVAWIVFIVYVEGYRAFQKRFSPRVVARAFYLAEHPRPLHVVLAPLYCMALLHTTRRRLIASWILVAGIVFVILLVRLLPPIYRAIIDAGVACALAWGTLVMIVFFVQRLRGIPMPVAPDVPEEETQRTQTESARPV